MRRAARHAMDWETQDTRKVADRESHGTIIERPEGSQLKLVQGQKSGSRLREMEGNCGRPMPPTGRRGLDKFITFLICLNFSATLLLLRIFLLLLLLLLSICLPVLVNQLASKTIDVLFCLLAVCCFQGSLNFNLINSKMK